MMVSRRVEGWMRNTKIVIMYDLSNGRKAGRVFSLTLSTKTGRSVRLSDLSNEL